MTLKRYALDVVLMLGLILNVINCDHAARKKTNDLPNIKYLLVDITERSFWHKNIKVVIEYKSGDSCAKMTISGLINKNKKINPSHLLPIIELLRSENIHFSEISRKDCEDCSYYDLKFTINELNGSASWIQSVHDDSLGGNLIKLIDKFAKVF